VENCYPAPVVPELLYVSGSLYDISARTETFQGAGMKEIKIAQTRTDGKITIDMWFKALDLLFDASDPFPFPEKELTDLAENSIFESFIDLALWKDVVLVLHIPRGSVSQGGEDQVANAVRRHFSFRLDDLAREKKSSWREGQVSVLLALINACIGIVVFYFYFQNPTPPFFTTLIFGVFVIMNWVTVWDSYEYFLYDWRKLWRKYRVYEKLTQVNVVIRQTY